jgi:hypothetical protein
MRIGVYEGVRGRRGEKVQRGSYLLLVVFVPAFFHKLLLTM